jgi:hypothetical protein
MLSAQTYHSNLPIKQQRTDSAQGSNSQSAARVANVLYFGAPVSGSSTPTTVHSTSYTGIISFIYRLKEFCSQKIKKWGYPKFEKKVTKIMNNFEDHPVSSIMQLMLLVDPDKRKDSAILIANENDTPQVSFCINNNKQEINGNKSFTVNEKEKDLLKTLGIVAENSSGNEPNHVDSGPQKQYFEKRSQASKDAICSYSLRSTISKDDIKELKNEVSRIIKSDGKGSRDSISSLSSIEEYGVEDGRTERQESAEKDNAIIKTLSFLTHFQQHVDSIKTSTTGFLRYNEEKLNSNRSSVKIIEGEYERDITLKNLGLTKKYDGTQKLDILEVENITQAAGIICFQHCLINLTTSLNDYNHKPQDSNYLINSSGNNDYRVSHTIESIDKKNKSFTVSSIVPITVTRISDQSKHTNHLKIKQTISLKSTFPCTILEYSTSTDSCSIMEIFGSRSPQSSNIYIKESSKQDDGRIADSTHNFKEIRKLISQNKYRLPLMNTQPNVDVDDLANEIVSYINLGGYDMSEMLLQDHKSVYELDTDDTDPTTRTSFREFTPKIQIAQRGGEFVSDGVSARYITVKTTYLPGEELGSRIDNSTISENAFEIEDTLELSQDNKIKVIKTTFQLMEAGEKVKILNALSELHTDTKEKITIEEKALLTDIDRNQKSFSSYDTTAQKYTAKDLQGVTDTPSPALAQIIASHQISYSTPVSKLINEFAIQQLMPSIQNNKYEHISGDPIIDKYMVTTCSTTMTIMDEKNNQQTPVDIKIECRFEDITVTKTGSIEFKLASYNLISFEIGETETTNNGLSSHHII